MKRLIKLLVAAVIYYSGAELILRKLFPRKSLAIFMFHSVQEPGPLAELAGFCMDPDSFEKKIRFLSRYNCLCMTEISKAMGGRSLLPRDAVVITFDDGYADNYYVAYPILKKYNIPAIIYIATDYMDTDRWLPFNRLYDGIHRTALKQIVLPEPFSVEKDGRPIELRLETQADKIRAITTIRQKLKQLETEELERIADILGDRLLSEVTRPRGPEFDMLQWQHIKAMEDQIEFGSHTLTHCIVSKVNDERLVRELTLSKAAIEQYTTAPVIHFAYPNGHREDYNKRAIEVLRTSGYKTAVTTICGVNYSLQKPYELMRLSVGGPNCLLALELLGIFGAMRQWLTTAG